MVIGLYILGILYALAEGKREAYYDHVNAIQGLIKENMHYLYNFQRILVVLGFSILFDGWNRLIFIIAAVLCFSFFHNGYYFKFRNKLNPLIYNKKFRDEKADKTEKGRALLEFNFVTRSIMFILGTLIFIYLWIAVQIN